MKVLITPRGFANVGLAQIEHMRSIGLEVHYNTSNKAYTHEEFIHLARDVDAIIVGVDNMDKEMLEHCPKLKVICKFGVGIDNIDTAYAKEKGIYVGRCVGSNSKSVAEHVIALMFAHAKNLYPSLRDVKHHDWSKLTGSEISGKKLGIIGFGMIGQYLSDFAYALGMEVLAYDAFEISQDVAKQHHTRIATFDEILRECDYISLHVPLVSSTRNMIAQKEFKKMKNTACLLNTARGGIVDENALYEALKSKEIAGACFDVLSNEPPLKDEKLLTLDTFLLTAHIGARSAEAEQRTCELSSAIVVEQLLGKECSA